MSVFRLALGTDNFFALAVSVCSRRMKSWRHACSGGGIVIPSSNSSCRQRIKERLDGICDLHAAHSHFASWVFASYPVRSISVFWVTGVARKEKDEAVHASWYHYYFSRGTIPNSFDVKDKDHLLKPLMGGIICDMSQLRRCVGLSLTNITALHFRILFVTFRCDSCFISYRVHGYWFLSCIPDFKCINFTVGILLACSFFFLLNFWDEIS